MADEPQTAQEPSLAEQAAVARERVAQLAAEAILVGEDGPFLDLDLFTRMLLQRAIEYRTLNREIAYAELEMIRAEQDTQRTIASQASTRADDMPRKAEAAARLEALRAREKQILDQLWPLP